MPDGSVRFGSAYSSRTGRSEATVTVGKRATDQVRANVTSGLLENREIAPIWNGT